VPRHADKVLVGCAGSDGDVVGDVPARRLPGEEPGVVVVDRGSGLGAYPGNQGQRVVVSGREAVLGRETVAGREDEGRELAGEAEAARVDVGQVEAADAEPAAVEEDEHRELPLLRDVVLLGSRGWCRRLVDAEL
jgi:hypothetical protein